VLLHQDRDIYGYDSFEGFPEPTEPDESWRKAQKGEWSHSPSGKYKYEPTFIRQILATADIDDNQTLTKGFFKDTLANHPKKLIALLHIDCDLYESHLDSLRALYGKVSTGGIIVFDDIHDDSYPGGRTATWEFLGDNFNNMGINQGKYYYVKP